MCHLKRFMGVSILLLVLTPAWVQAGQQLPIGDLDDYVAKAIEEFNVAGLALGIVKDDQLVYAKGFGVKNVDDPSPVDEHTLFAIGSTTKAFTAALVGMLVDEGKLRWDDKVSDRLPGFQLYDPYVTREITIRDILCHRSGLPRGDRLWYGSSFSREEVVRRVRHLEPNTSFRSRYGYQNIMFLVAGQTVAAVTGKSWDDNIKLRIFQPLGMRESNTSVDDFRPESNVATPHNRTAEKLTPIPWRDIDNIGPAGSINSNVVEMAQWIRVQLGGGVFEGRSLWSEAVMREMHSPQMVVSGRREGTWHLRNYGFAWALQDYRGKFVVSHGGSIDGMNAMVGLMPEEKLGVVVLANVNGSPINSPLMFRIFDAYLGLPEDQWQKVQQPQRGRGRRGGRGGDRQEQSIPEGTAPSLTLDRYAGDYQSEMFGEARVDLEDEKLIVRFEAYPKAFLEHQHLDTFQALWQDKHGGQVSITFSINARGRVTEMTVGGMGDFRRGGG